MVSLRISAYFVLHLIKCESARWKITILYYVLIAKITACHYDLILNKVQVLRVDNILITYYLSLGAGIA
jgi:hypothetical protein